MSNRRWKPLFIRRSERLYRWILRLVQASDRHLSDRLFADNDPISGIVEFYAASIVSGRNLPVCNGSSENCSDVWSGYKC